MNQETSIAQNLTIGTCVELQHSHTPFFIAEIGECTSGAMILSRGMTPIKMKYKAVTENLDLIYDANEFSVRRILGDRNKTPTEVAQLVEQAETKSRNYQVEAERNRIKAQARKVEFQQEAKQKMPPGTQSVIVAEFCEDKSDLMSDYWGSTTSRTLILAWSTHTRDLFPEMRKAALNADEVKHLFDAPADAEHREKWSMGGGYYLKDGYRHSTGWQINKVALCWGKEKVGNPDRVPVGEWRLPSPLSSPVSTVQAQQAECGAHVEEHVHTKKGFTMYLVVMHERIEREKFVELREMAERMGGWYSAKWGGTPGGYAFKEQEAADSFISLYFPASDTLPRAEPSVSSPAAPREVSAPKATSAMPAKLRAMAEAVEAAITDKLRSRETNTPKRLAQARHSEMEGYQLQRTQTVLRKLADLYESGTVPPALFGITGKAVIHSHMGSKKEQVANGFHSYSVETGEPSGKDAVTLAFWELLKDSTPAVSVEQQMLQRKIDGLQFSDIPGYFPTPPAVVSQLLYHAQICEGDVVLEPNGGSGAILDEVCRLTKNVKTYEVNFTLSEILQLKGFDVTQGDFTEVQPEAIYDRVVMNPPFENLQDADHVQHAFQFLKSGGRLVAVMSPSAFQRGDKKSVAFRCWFDLVGGDKFDLPEGSFKASGTGVSTVMVVIDKE